MWLTSITKSNRPDKRLQAKFCMCKVKDSCKGTNTKTIHFGQKGSSTYLDHKDEDKRSAYLARHKPNENWNNPLTAGALSRFILWNKKTLTESIADFKKRFKL